MHINHHSMCALLAADKLIISSFLRFTLNKHLFPNASHSIEWKEWVLLEPDRTASCAQQRVQNQYCISSIFALKIVTKSWIMFGTSRQSWEISYMSADFKNSPFPPVPNIYLFINLPVKCAELRSIFAISGNTSREGWLCEKEHPCSERGLGSWAGLGWVWELPRALSIRSRLKPPSWTRTAQPWSADLFLPNPQGLAAEFCMRHSSQVPSCPTSPRGWEVNFKVIRGQFPKNDIFPPLHSFTHFLKLDFPSHFLTSCSKAWFELTPQSLGCVWE